MQAPPFPRRASVTRACHNDFVKTTRLRCAAILHRLCVSVPAASIGLGRVMPELLLLHLEADGACRASTNLPKIASPHVPRICLIVRRRPMTPVAVLPGVVYVPFGIPPFFEFIPNILVHTKLQTAGPRPSGLTITPPGTVYRILPPPSPARAHNHRTSLPADPRPPIFSQPQERA